MNRLTTREEHPHGAEGRSKDKLTGKYCRGVFEATAVVEKLSYYENMEEDGRMIILPCKLGDMLYSTQFVGRKWEIFLYKVSWFEIMKSHGKIRIEIHFEGTQGYALCDDKGNLDEGWYLTEQEAKEALEKM